MARRIPVLASEMSSTSLPSHDRLSGQPAPRLNRVIWMLWLQGFQNAPEVVSLCLRSWKVRNPTWQVVELSSENLGEFIDNKSLSVLRALDIKPALLADLIRMYLLSRHGGVWADGTVFCCQPLDRWIDDYAVSGFFAFRNPGRARVLATWFLAAEKGNPIPSEVYQQLLDFLKTNKFPLQHTVRGRDRLRRLYPLMSRSSRTAEWWTSPLVVKLVKAYPYFIVHHHFARVVRKNAACRDVWSRTPVFSADSPRKMNKAGILSPITDDLLDDLRNCRDPLYKLTYKYRREYFTEGCILDHIMASLP